MRRGELPHNIIAENNVISSLIVLPENAIEVVSKCKNEWFYNSNNMNVFKAIEELVRCNQSVDLLLITNKCRQIGVNERDCDYINTHLVELMDNNAVSSNVMYYVAIIKDLYDRRCAIIQSTDLIKKYYDPEIDLSKSVSMHQEKLNQIVAEDNKTSTETTKELSENFPSRYELMRSGGLIGLSTGIKSIDEIFGGLRDGNMFVLAARPSMGKTSLAMCMAISVAMSGKRVLVFSCEQSREELFDRMICQISHVNYQRMSMGRLNNEEFHQISQGLQTLYSLDIIINDRSSITTGECNSIVHKCSTQKKVDLIVFDYIQIMGSSGTDQNDKITSISQGIKAMLKKFECPGIVLSQLSRAIEREKRGTEPVLSDLRGSGSLEQDADKVGFLHRPEMDGKNQKNVFFTDGSTGTEDLTNKAYLYIRKNRNGPLGNASMHFVKESFLFQDYNETEHNYEEF